MLSPNSFLSRHRRFFVAIGIVALLLVVLLVWFFHFNTTIYRTTWGFLPSERSISLGDTITFKNMTDTVMWPASDVHPSHTVYSAFDSLGSVDPGESWSFTFKRTGEWLYHDHLSTQFTGMITVYDENGSSAFDCSGDDKEACWAAVLTRAVRDEGVEAAYDVFVDIHQKTPDFAARCHNYVHDIGLKTYIFHGTDIELTPKTSYCNAGFFHGYMEGLISDASDLTEATAFCDQVKDELEETFPLADEQCRHGIGHGILEHFILTRPDLYASHDALLREAVKVCEETNETFDHLMRCASGAYNVYRDFITLNEEFQEYTQKENLFKICEVAKADYEKEACYWELAKLLTRLDSIDQMLRDIETVGTSDVYVIDELITGDDRARYLPFATRSWALIVGKHAVSTFKADTTIRACDFVPELAKESCLTGVFEGAFTSSEPHREYLVFEPMCSSPELDDGERRRCYDQFQKDLHFNYGVSEYEGQCGIVPEEYKSESVCGRVAVMAT